MPFHWFCKKILDWKIFHKNYIFHYPKMIFFNIQNTYCLFSLKIWWVLFYSLRMNFFNHSKIFITEKIWILRRKKKIYFHIQNYFGTMLKKGSWRHILLRFWSFPTFFIFHLGQQSFTTFMESFVTKIEITFGGTEKMKDGRKENCVWSHAYPVVTLIQWNEQPTTHVSFYF